MIDTTALAALLAVAFAACNSADPTPDNAPAFNAAMGKVFNPSGKKGGTLTFARASDGDSVDPGDTYDGASWNLLRLYGRSLVMYRPVPGAAGNELVPDLAESLGVPSDGGKTWTYRLRPGLKYEDGTVITSQDVKYAVLRTIDKEVLVHGPSYFGDLLDLQGYRGPYKDPGRDTTAIETPDNRTITFHLRRPFAGFDQLAEFPATVPVPRARDTGTKYKEHVISSGPYMFSTYQADKGFTLTRNPHWDPATDPNRKALPDGYEIKLNMDADDVDNQLIAGTIHADIGGLGVQSAAVGRILTDPALKANADNPVAAALRYTSINPEVAPLTNIECRKALLYAADRTGYQRAYGGPLAGGDIATGLIPPQIPGSPRFDLYPAGADNTGDLTKAKQALTACGRPAGFETNMAYQAENPKEKALAESLQQSLGRVGIRLTLKPIPGGDYYALYAGRPSYRDANRLGLMTNFWAADWNDGYPMLAQIVDSRAIRESGGSFNLSVKIAEVDRLLDTAIAEPDPTKREQTWAQIDRRVMQEAVILPGIFVRALTLRGKGTANVFIHEAFAQYDYLAMSLE